MLDIQAVVVLTICIALLFDFVNGWNDSANAIATVVSTKVLSPVKAVLMAACLNFLGALLGTGVAKTIAGKILQPEMITNAPGAEYIMMAAMLAAAVWVAGCTFSGLPISGSHSLIGGMLGAGVAFYGSWGILHVKGLLKVLMALVTSPPLGLAIGFTLMLAIIWICRKRTPTGVNRVFGRLQIVSAALMAVGHGMNDAQKVMGVITLQLFTAGWIPTLEVPFWVIVSCASVMGFGTYVGGWKVIKTLGHSLIKLQPVHGFAAETAASVTIFGASVVGLPVSTTHCITGSIMGVGSTKGIRAVKWGLGKKIAYAWLFTLPGCALLSGAVFYVIKTIFV